VFLYTPEIWAVTAGPTDITQWGRRMTATTAPRKRMGTKMKPPPPIAWAAATTGLKRTGSSLPNMTMPATKASQPPADKSQDWIPINRYKIGKAAFNKVKNWKYHYIGVRSLINYFDFC
jgi:hypothetical protein